MYILTLFLGWILACNENSKIGLVPSNYIGILLQSETGQTYIEHNGQRYSYTRNPSVGSSLNTDKSEKNNLNEEESGKSVNSTN